MKPHSRTWTTIMLCIVLGLSSACHSLKYIGCPTVDSSRREMTDQRKRPSLASQDEDSCFMDHSDASHLEGISVQNDERRIRRP